MKSLETRCTGGHSHIRIEGQFTKKSAVYTPELAAFLAKHITAAVKNLRDDQTRHPHVAGLESIVIDDVLSQVGVRLATSMFLSLDPTSSS